ncbi:MAG: Gfo/Idh/MocA family protein [Anaerolineae bacterium]
MHPLKFAIFGTGFWARFQLAGWREIGGTECVAVYNRTVAKAEAFAREFGIPAVYGDPEVLLTNENLDFVDIITDVGTHSQFVHLAAAHGLPVVCQKPMAPDLETARTMVQVCANAGVPLLINENWRWQYPIRQFKRALVENDLGWPFRAHIRYINSFPVFDNQPFLKDLEEFIIADIGSHILDTARYLFGDAQMLYCQTQRVTPGIQGEDVATVMLQMESGMTVVASMSYASPVEHDRFPETYIHVECERGAVELGPDFWVRVTTDAGTLAQRHQPPHYPWADPAYDVVHASIVSCQEDLLHALRTGTPAETSGADNFKTMQLVFGAYRSARSGQVV